MKNAIEFKNVRFAYGEDPILADVSFMIHDGDYAGIIGPNGGGKTTIIKLMLGLLKPQEGEIRIFGWLPEKFKERSKIGYVPQKASQGDYFPASVKEIIQSGRTAQIGFLKIFRKKDRRAVDGAMDAAEVAHLKNRLIGSLSGGERQRVFIARALAAEPKMLILDEPTAEADIASQEKFYSLLRKLNASLGITIILVSHDIAVVAKEAKTVLCINRELLCHTASGEIVNENFLEKIYGKNIRAFPHKH